MLDGSKISNILDTSPSVELLRLRNREAIIIFLINTFSNQQSVISFENIHIKLADFLEFKEVLHSAKYLICLIFLNRLTLFYWLFRLISKYFTY